MKMNWGDFVQGNFVHPIFSFQFRAGKFRAHNKITCTGNFVHGNYVHENNLENSPQPPLGAPFAVPGSVDVGIAREGALAL